MSLFPIFVKLEGRLLVVIGGGQVAEAKIPGLLSTGQESGSQRLRSRHKLPNGFDLEKSIGCPKNLRPRIWTAHFW